MNIQGLQLPSVACHAEVSALATRGIDDVVPFPAGEHRHDVWQKIEKPQTEVCGRQQPGAVA
ncbi:hypothetical protein ACS91J_17465 [Pectobacterium carotovorum]